MAKTKSLASMSVDALLKLRDDIGAALSKRGDDLRRQLASLTGTHAGNGRKRGRPRKSSLKGRKVAAKYRSKKNPKLTWAGRGATPRWMREEMKARKLKKDAFLIQ
jgi:DNA-binding protein H-NS